MTKTNLLACMLALVFLLSGFSKLAELDFAVRDFERWGYPSWFMTLTGFIEVIGAIGLLMPRFSALTAAGLALFMTGAVGTHLIHAEWLMSYIAGSIMLAAGLRAWEDLKN